MPTNTTGSTARNNYDQDVSYLRKRVTFNGTAISGTGQPTIAYTNTTIAMGTIPAGSTILAPISGVDVLTVFNAGTNNRLNIGITGTTAKYATVSSLLTVGFVAMAVAVGHTVDVDTPIVLTLDITGTAPTTGDVTIVIAYTKANDVNSF
jgi:hypothetical protein